MIKNVSLWPTRCSLTNQSSQYDVNDISDDDLTQCPSSIADAATQSVKSKNEPIGLVETVRVSESARFHANGCSTNKVLTVSETFLKSCDLEVSKAVPKVEPAELREQCCETDKTEPECAFPSKKMLLFLNSSINSNLLNLQFCKESRQPNPSSSLNSSIISHEQSDHISTLIASGVLASRPAESVASDERVRSIHGDQYSDVSGNNHASTNDFPPLLPTTVSHSSSTHAPPTSEIQSNFIPRWLSSLKKGYMI